MRREGRVWRWVSARVLPNWRVTGAWRDAKLRDVERILWERRRRQWFVEGGRSNGCSDSGDFDVPDWLRKG